MDTPQQKPLNVLLIGESCIDEYKYGSVDRISPEAPVPVIRHTHTIRKDGMAINVKNNLEALGCRVKFLTNNPEQIIKRRFVDEKSNQQLLREDIEISIDPLHMDYFNADAYDALVISDYCKGFLTPNIADKLCSLFRGKVFVDTKREDLSCFPYAAIKLNDLEDSKAHSAHVTTTKVVTAGAEGSWCEGVHYPAQPVQVHDVTGAGDVFLAALAVFATKSNIQYGVEAATALATRSVEHFGTYTITEQDLRDTGYFLL